MKPLDLAKVKKTAVFGMAVSGISAVKCLRKMGIEVYAVNQGAPATWKDFNEVQQLLSSSHMVDQDQASDLFASVDLIIISPGIPSTHPILAKAHEKNVSLISEIELAYLLKPEIPLVAITGTNGKTTTTTMIAGVLELSGKKVFCGGNIGRPYSDIFLSEEDYDIAMIEVSSFQLENIESFHPHIAFILNLTLSHTERYQGIQDYGAAKWRITKNLTRDDVLILGAPHGYDEKVIQSGKWQKIFFNSVDLPQDFLRTFSFSQSKLKGRHNQANFFAAYQVLEMLQIPDRKKIFQDFINSFKGVPHRLEYVANYQGLQIYNDAKSTNIQATITALNAFEHEANLYLVLGGKPRSLEENFSQELKSYKGKIKLILAIGEAGPKLLHQLGQDFSVIVLKDIFELKNNLVKGKYQGVLVFSPALPSFDQFRNYVHRGEEFKKMIYSLV